MSDPKAVHNCIASPLHEIHHGDFEEANRAFFNAPGTAEQYTERLDPDAEKRTQKIAGAMLEAYPFNQERTTVMHFACGAGLISRELAPHSKSIVGVDISQRMVDQYNCGVRNQGISPGKMNAICVSALEENEEKLQGMTFDVIVCASAYHHLPSIDNVTKILATYLKPGGSLLVTDVMKGDSENICSHSIHDIVPHKGGFTEDDIRVAFCGAGLNNFGFAEIAKKTSILNEPLTVFLARGDKQ